MAHRMFPAISALLALAALATFLPAAAAPKVVKVDPPGWFTDLKTKSVTLLVQGENLADARAVSLSPSLKAKSLRSSANGRYLFVQVDVLGKARPGAHGIRLLTPSGPVDAPFSLGLSCKGKHEPAGFSPADVVYLLMPDRFSDGNPANNSQPSNPEESKRELPRGWHGGDFAGLTARMDYFAQLGVTAVWLTPIVENAGPISYHGYHATDFYSPDPHFGKMEEFRAFVDRAHAAGLKVVQDQVMNHTGPAHPWAQDPPTPTWFNGTPQSHLNCDWNIPGLASPHSDTQARDRTTRGWFAGILPDLNADDPLLRRYLVQNSIWWVAMSGIDGIRIDTYPYTDMVLWKEWFPALREEFPRLTMVGEVMEWKPSHLAYWQQGFRKIDGSVVGPDSVMDFCWMRSLPEVYRGKEGWKPVRDLAGMDYVYPAPTMVFTFLDNHDTERFPTTLQSGGAIYRNALAATLLLRGIPQIYSGGELGLSGRTDPENRQDFPGGFPGDSRNAFTGKDLTADERTNLEWTRQVLAARKKCEALQSGTYTEVAGDGDVIVVRKKGASGEALLLFYCGSEPRAFEWKATGAASSLSGEWKPLVPAGKPLVVTPDGFSVQLSPYDVRVWTRP